MAARARRPALRRFIAKAAIMTKNLFRRFAVAAAVCTGMALALPAAADTRVNIGVGVGYSWGGGYGYGGGYGGGYHHNHYRRPPNVYYPPPAVIYQAPTPPDVVYVVPNAPAQMERVDRAYCREYTTETVIAGKRRPTYGTACRQPDGSWRIIN